MNCKTASMRNTRRTNAEVVHEIHAEASGMGKRQKESGADHSEGDQAHT